MSSKYCELLFASSRRRSMVIVAYHSFASSGHRSIEAFVYHKADFASFQRREVKPVQNILFKVGQTNVASRQG